MEQEQPVKQRASKWVAFLVDGKGQPVVLSESFQKDLKKALNNHSNCNVLAIVKGKSFNAQKSVDIVFQEDRLVS